MVRMYALNLSASIFIQVLIITCHVHISQCVQVCLPYKHHVIVCDRNEDLCIHLYSTHQILFSHIYRITYYHLTLFTIIYLCFFNLVVANKLI